MSTVPIDFVAGPWFVLRTPTLPLESYLAWTRAQRAPEEKTESNACTFPSHLDELRRWANSAVVQEALFIASPQLIAAIERWAESSSWNADARMLRTLLSYRARMSSRCTPFGLFASYSIGTLASESNLRLSGTDYLRRAVRLDFDIIEALARKIATDPMVRDYVPYALNDTVHRLHGRVHYVEARLVGETRRHAQVSADDSPELHIIEGMSELVAAGATRSEIAAHLVSSDPSILPSDALAFVDELCTAGFLRPSLLPPLTGDDGLRVLTERTKQLPGAEAIADRLAGVADRLSIAERVPLGDAIPHYKEIVDYISSNFDVHPTPGRALQIDLFDESPGLTLESSVATKIAEGIETLHRIFGEPRRNDLHAFAEAFAARYETADVPLLEVLDPDIGIGYGQAADPPASDLIRYLESFQSSSSVAQERPQLAHADRKHALLRIATEAIARGSTVVNLTDTDIAELTVNERAPLPDAFTALVALARQQVCDRGAASVRDSAHILIGGTIGPSALRYFGRFCQRDERMLRLSRELAQSEESLRPECDFVEVVHLPDGRTGNVAARPLLRKLELAYITPSGSAPENLVRPQDLLVSVVGEEVILRSRVTGRRLLPRLASAHYMGREGLLPLYRFLGAVQAQGCCEGLDWRWGDLEQMVFLPRVQWNGIIFAKARWRLRWSDISRESDAGAALERFRTKWSMPGLIQLEEGDNLLLLDLDTRTGRAALLHNLERSGSVRLVEMWPSPADLATSEPDGDRTHELLVPFTRRKRPTPASNADGETDRRADHPSSYVAVRKPLRRFTLGSEWAFLKLYVGVGHHDRLLVDHIQPALSELRSVDASCKAFFVRYADPSWHLRLRIRVGEIPGLHVETLIALNDRLSRSSLVWQSQFATYEREIERYGGIDCIDQAETWFSLDSDFALNAISYSRSMPQSAARDALMLAAADDLLDAAGLDLRQREQFAQNQADRFLARLSRNGAQATQLRHALARRARDLGRVSSSQTALRHARGAEDVPPEGTLWSILGLRSTGAKAYFSMVDRVHAMAARNDIIASLIHMTVNRLAASRHAIYELSLYDALARQYRRALATAGLPLSPRRSNGRQ